MCVLFVLQHQVAAAAVSHSLSPDSHVSAASEGIRTDLADLEKKKENQYSAEEEPQRSVRLVLFS